MKKNKYLRSLSILALIFMFSCSNNDTQKTEGIPVAKPITASLKENTKLKEKFGFALAKALHENLKLRAFIKAEALKQITRDYDVIYQVVKDRDVNGNQKRNISGQTIREILLPFFQNENELVEIESKLPLLTIFVPDLMGGSFSAANWDTVNEIPLVGIRSYESDDVKIIKYTGESVILEAKYMPDFPIVVVKDNERVVSNLNLNQYNALNTTVLTDESNPIQLKYASSNYYQILSNTTNYTAGPRVNQVLVDAYNAYGNYTPGGWQRDFVYYGLTPTNVSGGLNPSYREHLTSFKLSGSPWQSFSSITSGQDPHLRIIIGYDTSPPSGWTDGAYEFKVTNNYGAKNSNLGTAESKQFGANPTDIFDITYHTIYLTHPSFGLTIKIPEIINVKTIDFYNDAFYGVRMEFSVWDLNNFSNQWKLSFEEVDSPTVINNSTTATNKFNANFSLEPGTGILKKIGLKFGASYEQNTSNTYSTSYTDVSDDLGNSVVNFYDNAVNLNTSTNTLQPRTYSTGEVIFEFRPLLVQ